MPTNATPKLINVTGADGWTEKVRTPRATRRNGGLAGDSGGRILLLDDAEMNNKEIARVTASILKAKNPPKMYKVTQRSGMLDCALIAYNHGAQAAVVSFSQLKTVGKVMAAELELEADIDHDLYDEETGNFNVTVLHVHADLVFGKEDALVNVEIDFDRHWNVSSKKTEVAKEIFQNAYKKRSHLIVHYPTEDGDSSGGHYTAYIYCEGRAWFVDGITETEEHHPILITKSKRQAESGARACAVVLAPQRLLAGRVLTEVAGLLCSQLMRRPSRLGISSTCTRRSRRTASCTWTLRTRTT